MRFLIRSRSAVLVLAAAALLVVAACSAKTVRDKARVGALVASDAAITISQTESNLYASIHYDAGLHDSLSTGKLKLLYLAQAYDSAVLAWPVGAPTPASVESARTNLLVAIDDFARLIPATAAIRDPLNAALIGLREAIAAKSSARELPPVQRSEALPPSGAMAIFAIAQMIVSLITSGRTEIGKLRELLRKEGATDEELDGSIGALSDEIARVNAEREREHPF